MFITLQFIKTTFPKRQHGFCWKANESKCSCASVGQEHTPAHIRTITQLPISNVVTLTETKAPLGAKKQAHWNPPLNQNPSSSIPEPKSYPEPPQCNWMDTKSTYTLNTKQRTHVWKPTYLCHHLAQSCQCCSTCCCYYSHSSHPCRPARHSQLGWKFCKKYEDGNFYSLSLSILKPTDFIQTMTHFRVSKDSSLSRGMLWLHQPFQISVNMM